MMRHWSAEEEAVRLTCVCDTLPAVSDAAVGTPPVISSDLLTASLPSTHRTTRTARSTSSGEITTTVDWQRWLHRLCHHSISWEAVPVAGGAEQRSTSQHQAM